MLPRQAFTSAYTVIVECNHTFAVYFGGRFAYMVNLSDLGQQYLENFNADVAHHNTASCRSAETKYGIARIEPDLS